MNNAVATLVQSTNIHFNQTQWLQPLPRVYLATASKEPTGGASPPFPGYIAREWRIVTVTGRARAHLHRKCGLPSHFGLLAVFFATFLRKKVAPA